GLPVSIDSARASFSRSRSIRSAIWSRNFDRSAADFLDQSTNAFSAAATATSTSRSLLSATCEYGLPVAGSILSRYFPPIGPANWPSMKSWICGDSVRTRESKRSTHLRQGASVAGPPLANHPSANATASRAYGRKMPAQYVSQQYSY